MFLIYSFFLYSFTCLINIIELAKVENKRNISYDTKNITFCYALHINSTDLVIANVKKKTKKKGKKQLKHGMKFKFITDIKTINNFTIEMTPPSIVIFHENKNKI